MKLGEKKRALSSRPTLPLSWRNIDHGETEGGREGRSDEEEWSAERRDEGTRGREQERGRKRGVECSLQGSHSDN